MAPVNLARGGAMETGKPYVLYLCAGAEHENDLAHCIARAQGDRMRVVSVDYSRGGMDHDLSRQHVAQRWVEAARDPRCIAVIASPPCTT
eukprot:5396098-Pleurochrysis_carterae.AAC.2